MTRSATAFAPARLSGGRALSWESLAGTGVGLTGFAQLGVFLPNLAYNPAANLDVRYRVLTPVNVTRGVVTLERVVGQMFILNINEEFPATVEMSLQLATIRDGSIVDQAVLNTGNAADLESNKLIWRRLYVDGLRGSGQNIFCTQDVGMSDIQVRVRRRYDQATWALILVALHDSTTHSAQGLSINCNLRGLFRAPDGI